MHELAIAIDLVEMSGAEAQRLGAVRVDAVHVRIGPLSGVVREALLFCFDEVAAGTIIEGARLEIETEAVVVWCSECQQNRDVANFQHRRCPVCDCLTPRVVRGDSVELIALSVMDDAAAHR